MRIWLVPVALTVAFGVWPGAGPAGAQSDAAWTATRTAWDDPDLQGIWDFRPLTPMGRPAEHAGKAVLTAEEAALYVQDLPFSNWDDRDRWDRTQAFSFDSDIACHEGNYGLFNILTGARARERAGR